MLTTYSAHIVLGLLFGELALVAWMLNPPEPTDIIEEVEDDTMMFV